MLENINHTLSTSQIKIKHTHICIHAQIFFFFDFITHQMRAVSPTFHQRQCDRCYTSAPKRYSRKQQFFFLSFSSPPKYKLQRTRLRTLRLGSQQVYLFISMNTNTDTRENWNTHLYWRLAKWQCSVISRTWLYNWSLIDMKSSGLAQVVFYTCCRPRAGNAGGPLNLGAIFWLMSL